MGHRMGMVTPIIHGLYQVILRDSTVAPGNGKPNGKKAEHATDTAIWKKV